ncbi:hypothetical protein HY030_04545 [Candidatus Gottesmanbacteria bacterium]|nr:hypothetical protein [Candidatus Gottesmanbacteria bacterium]
MSTIEPEKSALKDVVGIGVLSITTERDFDGTIKKIVPTCRGIELKFESQKSSFIATSEDGTITIETQPPEGLSRKKSGHQEISASNRRWLVDIQTPREAITTTIHAVTDFRAEVQFTAGENEKTRRHPFIPFDLNIKHPAVLKPKTDILLALQIFGHMAAAARMVKSLPEPIRNKTFMAAKETDNVPASIKHMQQIGIFRDDLMIPLTYDDATSGGMHLQERKSAIWWLAQNPELVNRFMTAKVVISDLREETAWLKHMADCMHLPQIFLALTYAWPQRLDELDNLHPDLVSAFSRLPNKEAKIRALHEVGLEETDAVIDWFDWARRWKAGVVGNHAQAADAILTFGLVSPEIAPPNFDNCIVCPPRTHLETDSVEALWFKDKKKVVVILGSGDWTERELFVKNIITTANLLPDCHLIIVGPLNGQTPVAINLPSNITTLGFVNSAIVDGLTKSADIAVIKPGNISLGETAGTITLIAPTDNLEHSLEISKMAGNPRSVAIAVEVMEERLTTAVEEWISLGSPKYFSPLLDISSPEEIAAKITDALKIKDTLMPKLAKIPSGGTQLLATIVESLLTNSFSRSEVPRIVQQIKLQVGKKWEQEKI